MFVDLELRIYCDPNSSPKVTALLAKSDTTPLLRGTRGSGSSDLFRQLKELVSFLQNSELEWEQHMHELRDEFPELNFFTNRQIVRLRRYLAELLLDRSKLNPAAIHLLMALKNDASKNDVQVAVDELKAQQMSSLLAKSKEDSPDEEVRRFVEQLKNLGGLKEEEALRAAAAVGTGDVDAAIDWVYENDVGGMEAESEQSHTIPKDPSFAEKLCHLTEMYEKQKKDDSLAEKLAKIWRDHLNSQTNYQEFIGVRQLAVVLRHLAEQNSDPAPPVNLPDWVRPSEPNLVVANERDLLLSVLSMYYNVGLSGLRMDSVFICSKNSSAEELTLFLRRIRAPVPTVTKSRLFAIIGIGQLTSDVCHSVERELAELFGAQNYGLVLYCAREHYESCLLAGVLARNQRRLEDPICFNVAQTCLQRVLLHLFYFVCFHLKQL